jgi:hypothetical protein
MLAQIDCEGPIIWPPHYPELSQVVFLWGCIKGSFYATEVSDCSNRIISLRATETTSSLQGLYSLSS